LSGVVQADLMAKEERERLAVSLGLVGWLALPLYDRPDSRDEEVGNGPGDLPNVDPSPLRCPNP
jgi:hypothetical protein